VESRLAAEGAGTGGAGRAAGGLIACGWERASGGLGGKAAAAGETGCGGSHDDTAGVAKS